MDLLGWDVAGKDVLFLYTTAPLYFVIAIAVEYLMRLHLAGASRHIGPTLASSEASQQEDDDGDVTAEASRVIGGELGDDVSAC